MDNAKDLFYDIEKYYKRKGSRATIDSFEQDILNARIPELSYLFVSCIEGADIDKHKEIITTDSKCKYVLDNQEDFDPDKEQKQILERICVMKSNTHLFN